MISKIAVVGVGLIGSSLGLAFQDLEQVEEVVGIDQNSSHLQQALEMGVINSTASLKEGVQGVDLVIVATPVGTIVDLIEEITLHVDQETLITDVGSTKSSLVEQLEVTVAAKEQIYIAGHPMTGSEVVGPSGADKYLFENAIYVLTETEQTDQTALTALKALLEKLGAQVLVLDPKRHDQIVALTSHLPHIVAVNLMQVIDQFAQSDGLITSLTAGGFRDTTRIAAGDPTMWKDIFLYNQVEVLKVVEAFEDKLAQLKELIIKQAEEELLEQLTQARESRLQLPMKKKGLLPTNYELIITLKDEPNAIGQVASLLGKEGINIQDIEVLKVREDGGTLRLSLSQEEEQIKACTLLQEAGYKVFKK
ncbi:prephenate dehydrogenase/arogenate dehydrogenase family protein [Natroniella sp. ANB-PHB2]|uniref:prephenate dehydrogenase/arogenate dehydrogenase family protein n=1 Tax=Natroniella sp. ANB-PHB2 TaxID=3384444 RepID=UPI0038D3EB1C